MTFNEHLDRWGTHSAKWDLLASPMGREALSLSVADMEFASAPPVVQAVERAAALGAYGYTEVFDDFRSAAREWQLREHEWDPGAESVRFFPRIVQCVAALCHHVLPPLLGHRPRIMTLIPAYGPILEVVERSGCELIRVPLRLEDGNARMDRALVEDALERADLLLWCNPHNPCGRVWRTEELEFIGRAALEHGTMVLSDDIHADFTRPGRTPYTPLARAVPPLWDSGRLIQCASPGKTFNTAGLEAAAVFAPGALGDHLEAAKRSMGLHNPNYFAIPAAIAAWTRGQGWVADLRRYINGNLRFAVETLHGQLPRAVVTDPDGTYLIWIDARHYLPHCDSLTAACGTARVAVSPGEDFGDEYAGWFRVNAALPRVELEAGLHRLVNALTHPPK